MMVRVVLPLVGDKQRKVEARVHEDLATLPGPPVFSCGPTGCIEWLTLRLGLSVDGTPWRFLFGGLDSV